MKILFATSEAHPLIKTGGLADVSGSLPNALKAQKQNVRMVMPAYGSAIKKLAPESLKSIAKFEMDGCSQTYQGQILELKAGTLEHLDVTVWLVDIAELFGREGNPYLSENGGDWWDNGERFGVFSKVVVELAMGRLQKKWKADVVHSNDWQTGLVSALLQHEFERPNTVFTIHNMAYPGNFPYSLFAQLQIPHDLWGPHGVEFWGHFSMLKAGLVYADYVTTVSPTYATEICFWEHAYGFEGVLQERAHQGRLLGILNGIDYNIWNPEKDPWVKQKYSSKKGRVAAKKVNKEQLLEELSILKAYPVDDDLREHWREAPLIGFVGRLVTQKGIDLILETLPELIHTTSANFVFVGTGDSAFEAALETYAANFPERVYTFIGYSEKLAHEVEAGSDMFLMPSRFEPCGLNQMYSLVYGTPPIVQCTGGLADTVVNSTDENLKNKIANGFVFYELTSDALSATLHHAIHLFGKKRTWQAMQKTGMQGDYSWQQSAEQYVKLYEEIRNGS
jgi:starch synthase